MKKWLYCVIIMLALLGVRTPVQAASAPAPDSAANGSAESVVRLNTSEITIIPGKSYTLKLSGGSQKVTWSSSKKSVAAVKSTGTQKVKVTAKKAGSAVITAKAGKKKYKCRVKVIAAKLSASKKTLYRGHTFTLKVKKGTASKWESSNPSVAAVGKKGKVTAKKKGTATITAKIGDSSLKCKVTVKNTRWDDLLEKYFEKKKVKQLIFVKYLGGSKANVLLYRKDTEKWNRILKCSAYVGSNGIGKQVQGDKKTPTGVFNLTGAFGIKDDPGTALSYVKVNKYHYWCGDSAYYNRLVDVRVQKHSCAGEHLIDYVPYYYYGAFLDYNKKCTLGKGSAIFLHCSGPKSYTSGCIAVSQKNMITILQNIEPGVKICIYKK